MIFWVDARIISVINKESHAIFEQFENMNSMRCLEIDFPEDFRKAVGEFSENYHINTV